MIKYMTTKIEIFVKKIILCSKERIIRINLILRKIKRKILKRLNLKKKSLFKI